MYREADVAELLEEYGTIFSCGDADALTVYTEEDGVHGLVTVKDELDGNMPQPGRSTYRVIYRGIDPAIREEYTDYAMLAGSLHELEKTVDTALDRIQDGPYAYNPLST